jgi:hypothetical protein
MWHREWRLLNARFWGFPFNVSLRNQGSSDR